MPRACETVTLHRSDHVDIGDVRVVVLADSAEPVMLSIIYPNAAREREDAQAIIGSAA